MRSQLVVALDPASRHRAIASPADVLVRPAPPAHLRRRAGENLTRAVDAVRRPCPRRSVHAPTGATRGRWSHSICASGSRRRSCWRCRGAVPLAEWDPTAVALRDIPVGPSRHLVRFVEADGRLWALKALPHRVGAARVRRAARTWRTASCRRSGAAGRRHRSPGDDEAVLRHPLPRGVVAVPAAADAGPGVDDGASGRLFDAMAVLLVDLHRNGIYWGDCSLANTLFTRDGQTIQAWMVDAETAEFHPRLSDGQRQLDLDIMIENVAGGLLDVAARAATSRPRSTEVILEEAHGVVERYERALGACCTTSRSSVPATATAIESRVQRLNDLGFAVDEVRLETADVPTTRRPGGPDEGRVAGRRSTPTGSGR